MLQPSPLRELHTTDWGALTDVPAEPPQLVGRVLPSIAGYRLVRQVGQGRRSACWLAQDIETGSEAALKLAKARRGPGFGREFAIASSLRHDRVLRVYEEGCAGDLAYLAMEYLDGGDLARRMAAGFGEAQALDVLAQAATALAQLHRRGLVHRDVKPANFLLRADGGLVLADFGLVAECGEPAALPGSGALVGTPRYVAPEQAQGAMAQPAADVYSLGVLLHELLCGVAPFTGETVLELLSQHLMAAPPRLPAHLAALQPLADGLLAKDPKERLPDADAVLAQLESAGRAHLSARRRPARPAKGGTRDSE